MPRKPPKKKPWERARGLKPTPATARRIGYLRELASRIKFKQLKKLQEKGLSRDTMDRLLKMDIEDVAERTMEKADKIMEQLHEPGKETLQKLREESIPYLFESLFDDSVREVEKGIERGIKYYEKELRRTAEGRKKLKELREDRRKLIEYLESKRRYAANKRRVEIRRGGLSSERKKEIINKIAKEGASALPELLIISGMEDPEKRFLAVKGLRTAIESPMPGARHYTELPKKTREVVLKRLAELGKDRDLKIRKEAFEAISTVANEEMSYEPSLENIDALLGAFREIKAKGKLQEKIDEEKKELRGAKKIHLAFGQFLKREINDLELNARLRKIFSIENKKRQDIIDEVFQPTGNLLYNDAHLIAEHLQGKGIEVREIRKVLEELKSEFDFED